MPRVEHYHKIADQLVLDIKNGVLKPGDKLLPQREFAFQHNIAASTASRVYAELIKRGVAIGETGRGTFVRAFNHFPAELGEPVREAVNLQLNFSTLPGQENEMINGIAPMLRPDVLQATLQPVSVNGDQYSRDAAVTLLAHPKWRPNSDNILFTGGGRQGIAAVMATIASAGDRVGVEAMTYPIIKSIAAKLGIHLVPIEMDEDGLSIESLKVVHKSSPLKGVYFQSSMHNPLGISMSAGRRRELANFIDMENLLVVEDAVYSFLANDPPFAKIAPEQTFLIDSLSKRIAPDLGFGFILCPEQYKERCIASIRSGGWSSSNIGFVACQRWLSDGTVNSIVHKRREDAMERQKIAKEILSDFDIQSDPRSYHLWMKLPSRWRAEAFAAAAAKRGVSLSPATIFSMEAGNAPNAIRIALAPPTLEDLKRGLNIVKELTFVSEVEVMME